MKAENPQNLPVKKDRFGQILTLFAIVILAILILSKLLFMTSAVLGSIALYILFRKPHKYLAYRFKWGNIKTTIIILVSSFISVMLPIYLISLFLIHKLQPLINDPQPIIQALHTMNLYINQYIEFSLVTPEILNKISSIAQQVLPAALNSGLNFFSNLVLLYFLLWFMLNNGSKMETWLKSNSPFNLNHTTLLINHIKTSVIGNAIGIILLGLIQGLVAALGYYFFGVADPILWGIITGVVSVIPFVGTMLAWVPLSIFMMANGLVYNGIGLFLYGLFIVGSSDNVFRFILQKKLSSAHPLITVLGVISGLSLLGFWGLIFGPLMISLLIELIKIYNEEFRSVKRL